MSAGKVTRTSRRDVMYGARRPDGRIEWVGDWGYSDPRSARDLAKRWHEQAERLGIPDYPVEIVEQERVTWVTTIHRGPKAMGA